MPRNPRVLADGGYHHLHLLGQIERNPLRAKLVARAEDYPWSSYRHYAFGETDPLVDDNL